MILIDDRSPRWLRELARFLPLKSLLFLHGNVLDLVSFPVQRGEGQAPYWTEDDLPGFFRRFLPAYGYPVVGFVDPVDGLTFPDKTMEQAYRGLIRHGEAPPEGTEPSCPQTPRDKTAVPGIRRALANTKTPCAFVFPLASRLVTAPGQVSREERLLLTGLLKASQEAADVVMAGGVNYKNVIILICDKINDLPPWLFVGNPRARSILVDKPDSNTRRRFFRRLYPAFHGAESGPAAPELIARFTALTDGLTNYELMNLVHLSRREQLPIPQVENLCQRYKFGVRESEWDKLDQARLAGAEAHFRSRIKGQDQALARVLDIVKRARIGLAAGASSSAARPRGVLFFAGPTGVGKTEAAKSLAELIFGREDRCLRFDMSEYAAAHSDEKLLGAPPGYVGYEEGGQLTNALKESPFAVLLFDEIEKAHAGIFDKFLQILDDGRLTDGKGETVYFSETIIIFTSNLGTVSRDPAGGAKALVDPDTPFPAMRAAILSAIRDHFNLVLGRPEILNRFGDNFVVFNFIRPPVDEEIVDMLVAKLAAAARERWGLTMKLAPTAREKLVLLARGHLHHGGRGVRNAVDTALVNPLTRFLFDRLRIEESGSTGFGGTQVHIADLHDHGPDAPYRFEVAADILP